ncbi:MAG: tetratricopeptide repeat protein [Beijerinckiaceae bacterium]|nr:tetratricopeptide repeat protein [Beijerinckiaceae bacterium]
MMGSRRFPALPELALLASLALALGGCQPASFGDMTGSTPAAMPQDPGALRAYADDLGKKYDRRPDDKATALAYARVLKRLTQYAQATAVLQRIAVKNPHDLEILAAYGKALADAGRLQEAAEVLGRAHTPERPNWSVLSAQGSVADQLGNHDQAQSYYVAALKIVPDQPEVLSNLGLSYALQRQMPNAEQTLRKAAAQPGADMRVRQNLALVLALQGKFAEAEEVSRRDLAPIDAAANVASIRQMIAQSDTWKDIKTVGRRNAKPTPDLGRSAQEGPQG